ncbi:hypothetical protein V5799_007368 [Amblyomma americanum]|uniref:Secreted protein n=1 Tax=Amblyomma americanum TaxID=6943 RepID=A0AAQ4DTQ7_AMBAM
MSSVKLLSFALAAAIFLTVVGRSTGVPDPYGNAVIRRCPGICTINADGSSTGCSNGCKCISDGLYERVLTGPGTCWTNP